MNKLRLDLETLGVQTFRTVDGNPGEGRPDGIQLFTNTTDHCPDSIDRLCLSRTTPGGGC
jgi:hypothetical protein